MNTNNEVIYTMIGGLLIKSVPDDAVKVKILSNGFIYFINKRGDELLGYCNEPEISVYSDKFAFVVFDIPPLAPVFRVGSALGFKSFGESDLHSDKKYGGLVENGKPYFVGEKGLPAEAIQFYGRANREANDAPERFTNIYKRAHSSSSSIMSFCENVMNGKYMTIEELKCDFSKVDFGFAELRDIIESYPYLNSGSDELGKKENSINIGNNAAKEKTSLNILTLTFDSGSKLSDVLNMVESEISNSGINVVDDISSICVNSLSSDISSMIKDKMHAVSQKIATHIYEEEYDSVSVTIMMNELRTLEDCMRKLKR